MISCSRRPLEPFRAWVGRIRILILMASVVAVLRADAAAGAPSQHIVSPDRRIQVTIDMPEPGSSRSPQWSARFRGQPLFERCALGIQTVEWGDVLAGARVARSALRSYDQTIPVLFGKTAQARNQFNELRLAFFKGQIVRTDLVVRCYNDAIALRYEIVEDGNPEAKATISEEQTSFGVLGKPTAHVQVLENFKTSHEHAVTSQTLETVSMGALLDMPLTLTWPKGVAAAITEASLRRYAGMALSVTSHAAGATQLACRLSPRPDGHKVVRALPLTTPWRVVLLGEGLGALLESTTLFCLGEPCVLADTSWIRPGKITFHWWNGDVYDGVPGLPMLSTEMNRKYIDFCAREGIPTHSITSTEGITTPWYFQSKPGVEPGPDTDVTRPRPGFDLASIRAYADSRNVRLWTWVHQAALRGRVEPAFAAFEQMGWSGMMVDFFDHDDQDHVEFAEEILAAAARHHLLIQLHGIWKPTGLERTYPNLVNHEGALNLEYLKWSDRCTPEHTLRMIFTRMIAGPMDYHLGGFRAVTREAFQPRSVAPNVLGTRCHQLALYVCLDNPNPMLADYPAAYEGQAGFEFLKAVPTWWDETRVLEAEMGGGYVCARRKGREWYLGGLSALKPRVSTVLLKFLGRDPYELQLWKDPAEPGMDPNQLQREVRLVRAGDTIEVTTARDGGWVGVLRPRVPSGGSRP